jgi:chloramphenicol O-acetyltransferase type B
MSKFEIGEYSYFKDIINPLEVSVKIGKFCSISFHLTILGDDHACIPVPAYVTSYPFDALWGTPAIEGQKVKDEIIIGNDVWIGMNVCLRPGITIGDGAIIGAGTMVMKSVKPYEIVSGNPMRHMRDRFSQQQIDRLLEIKWWFWSEDKIRKNMGLLGNIDKFIITQFQE